MNYMSKSDSNEYELTYKDTTFFGLLKIFGIRAFLNWSMLYSILLTSVIILTIEYKGSDIYFSLAKYLAPTILGASATVFGIVLAALAVTISLFHPSLLPPMLKTKLLHKYMFPFWKAVAMWGGNIILSLFLIILTAINLDIFSIVKFIFIFNTFLFIYSTFYTVKLSGLVVQLTLQRAQL